MSGSLSWPAFLHSPQGPGWTRVMVKEPCVRYAARARTAAGGGAAGRQCPGLAPEPKVQSSRACRPHPARGFAQCPGLVVDAGNGQRTRRAVRGTRDHCCERRGGGRPARHPSPRYKVHGRVSLCGPAVLHSAQGPEWTRVMVTEPGSHCEVRMSYKVCGVEAALRLGPGGVSGQGTKFACVSASAGSRSCTVPRARSGRV